jgi:hypothetical protein
VKWSHSHKLATNPAFKNLLLALRDGLEKTIDAEKAKLEEYVQARKRMGG